MIDQIEYNPNKMTIKEKVLAAGVSLGLLAVGAAAVDYGMNRDNMPDPIVRVDDGNKPLSIAEMFDQFPEGTRFERMSISSDVPTISHLAREIRGNQDYDPRQLEDMIIDDNNGVSRVSNGFDVGVAVEPDGKTHYLGVIDGDSELPTVG